MKWGVRRYQNADGTRTAEGKERYRQGKLSPMTPKDRYKARSSRLYKKAVGVANRMLEIDQEGDPNKEWDVKDAELLDLAEQISKRYGNTSMVDIIAIGQDVWDDAWYKNEPGVMEAKWKDVLDTYEKRKTTLRSAKKDKEYKRAVKAEKEYQDFVRTFKGDPEVGTKEYEKSRRLSEEVNSLITSLSNKYGTYDNKIHDAANIEDAIHRDVVKLRKQK
jgi:hypothetical protein